MIRAIGIVLLVAVGYAAFQGFQDMEKAAPRAVPIVQATPPGPPAITPPELKLGELDRSYSVLKGDFTLINPNDFSIRDATLVCDVIAGSGTKIHTYRFQVFERIPAKSRKTVRGHVFGFWPQQGKSLSCHAQDPLR